MYGFEKWDGGNLSVYVHIPFCVARCHYCDFVSNVSDEERMSWYTDHLCRELEQWSRRLPCSRISTVFFGGGTPGLLPIPLLERITRTLRECFFCEYGAEWTIESNPDVTFRPNAAAWKEMGFNRVSLGLQSVNPEVLRILGRRSGPDDFLRALECVYSSGLTNVNADLMTSLPAEKDEDLLEAIRFVVDQDVAHISVYSLVLHEETILGREVSEHRLSLPDDDSDRERFSRACVYLAERGYERYEISNFARKERECRHNLVYWRGGAYLGAGTAASSFDLSQRWTNEASLKDYCSHIDEFGFPDQVDREVLTVDDSAFERLMLGLRLTEGIDLANYRERFGFDPVVRFETLFKKLIQEKMAKAENGRLSLTAKGMDVQNSILTESMRRME